VSDYFSARTSSPGSDNISAFGKGTDDAALWREVTAAKDLKSFATAWLSILARSSSNIHRACALVGDSTEHIAPVAVWSKAGHAVPTDVFLKSAGSILSAVLQTRQPAVEAVDGTAAPIHAGIPFIFDDVLRGAVLVEAELADSVSSRRLIRHLQWGSAWVETFFRRVQRTDNDVLVQRARLLVETLNAVVSQPRFDAACHAFANALAKTLKCDRVAIGHRGGHSTRLAVLLQTATFERKYNVTRAIEGAMDEAIDQKVSLAWPATENMRYTALAQEQLARVTTATSVLTVPMFQGDREVGAIALERFSGGAFTEDDIDVCEALCAAVGPILADKREKDSSIIVLAGRRALQSAAWLFGPRRLGLKALGVLAAAAALYLSVATDTYRIHARSQMQGEVRRVLSAPFDGYIRAQYRRAGQVAEEGQVLAEMQDNDLILDRLRHSAQRNQYQLELDRALAKRDLAQANVTRAQIEQKDAEIELVNQMLARTQIKSPFSSVIVNGDLSQSVGKPVSRGDTLFELAPLDQYRVTLMVPELEIQSVKPGQRGEVLLAALPERPFAFEVTTVTPVSHVQDGINGFEVHAVLRDIDARVRPGMEGVAKIEVGDRNIAWIWVHGLVDWLRIKVWALIP
jgi:hypothetical protein